MSFKQMSTRFDRKLAAKRDECLAKVRRDSPYGDYTAMAVSRAIREESSFADVAAAIQLILGDMEEMSVDQLRAEERHLEGDPD